MNSMSSALLAQRIRAHALRMVHAAKASHIASALSIADILAVLYEPEQGLRVRPDAPHWSGRDRFLLSKGHACVAVYAALAERGFFPVDELQTYGRDFARLMNHVSHQVPGVEFSTGSLGHALPFGVGKLLAARLRGETWRCVVLLSDGELNEGSNWEALMFAAHHGLDRLTVVVDANGLQSLTTTTATLDMGDLAAKFSAFGARVSDVDGHDHAALHAALFAPARGRPTVVIARTTKGKGVSFMENQVAWHYRSPNDAQLAQALGEIADAGSSQGGEPPRGAGEATPRPGGTFHA
ncbi:transketolase [Inhella sp.]|uniref:transketolase n=1 Tax=Inhella sp. TaxID=1921806 RepID=UPI0035B25976